jgi:cell division protein ZapA
MKQMEVSILGQTYVLACPEGGEANLLEAVALVDGEMSAIRDGGKVRSRERIAVLAALNLAYQLAERPTAAARPDGAALRIDREAAAPAGDLDALVQRIDAALGHDGQLL